MNDQINKGQLLNFTPQQFNQFVAEVTKEIGSKLEAGMMLGQKHDPTGTVVGGIYANGGLFSNPIVRPQTFSAIQQPDSFISRLPLFKSLIQNEVSRILTGMTDASGTNPTTVCDNPPIPGNLKACITNLTFGKAFVGSKLKDTTEVGLFDSYGVQPVEVQNWASDTSPLVPDPLRMTGVNFASEAALNLYEVSTFLRRIMARIEIDGNAALEPAATELGWIKEFMGLSRLIVDGITDIYGNACPAADSLVEAWDEAADATVNGLTIVQLIHDLYFAKEDLARQVGMEGTRFYWVMDRRLFRTLVFLFSCTYAMARCTDGSAGNPIERGAAELERRFFEQWNGRYLLISGMPVEVRFTSGAEIEEGTPNTGRIFLVPDSWNGRALTYLQYFPLDNAQVQEFNRIGNTTGRFYSNAGLYAFATRSNGFCDQLLTVSKLRMKVETPFLAARIDGVTFNNYVGYRNWNPAGSSFYNGGSTFYTQYFG